MTHVIQEEDSTVCRCFLSLASNIKSFRSTLRPLIGIDGTQLSGRRHGVLLVAMTHDLFSNRVRYSGDWEFQNLGVVLGHLLIGGQATQNLTDRMKWLTREVIEWFPNANHCYYVCHISKNINSWKSQRWWYLLQALECHSSFRIVHEGTYKYSVDIWKQDWANSRRFITSSQFSWSNTSGTQWWWC